MGQAPLKRVRFWYELDKFITSGAALHLVNPLHWVKSSTSRMFSHRFADHLNSLIWLQIAQDSPDNKCY